jgi:hypothetical protein
MNTGFGGYREYINATGDARNWTLSWVNHSPRPVNTHIRITLTQLIATSENRRVLRPNRRQPPFRCFFVKFATKEMSLPAFSGGDLLAYTQAMKRAIMPQRCQRLRGDQYLNFATKLPTCSKLKTELFGSERKETRICLGPHWSRDEGGERIGSVWCLWNEWRHLE